MTKQGKQKKGNQLQGTGKAVKKKSSSKSRKLFPASWSVWIFLALSGIIFLQTRIKLLAIPMERDEGSFAYIGHWLLQGRELYTHMLDSKLPGLYTLYALFTTLFGYNSTGIHIGLLLANVASAICFYFLAKELYNRLVAGIATVFYLFLAVSPNMVGFATHATQLLTPFVLGGFLLFWKGIRSGRWLMFFLSGLLIGIAFSIKQQSAIFGVLLAVIWWPSRLKWYKKENDKLPYKEWIWLGAGGLLPLVCIVTYFYFVGRLDEFYNWTFVQPLHLAGSFAEPWHKMFLNIAPSVVYKFEVLWVLALAGMVFIFLSRFKKEATWFGLFVALLGVVSVVIGAAYYLHYFVLAIPGVALLAACTLNWIATKTGKAGTWIALMIAAVLVGISMAGRTDYYFTPDFAKIHFEVYQRNMFPELQKIGEELAKRATKGQKIGIMGSEPEVLVAADRESCSRHLMVYALLSDPVLSPPLQQEYIEEMKECAPEYIVWNTVNGSWTKGYEQLAFFKEFMEWILQNYHGVGIAESWDDKPGLIVWDDAVNTHKATSDYKIYVLQKNSTTPTGMQ